MNKKSLKVIKEQNLSERFSDYLIQELDLKNKHLTYKIKKNSVIGKGKNGEVLYSKSANNEIILKHLIEDFFQGLVHINTVQDIIKDEFAYPFTAEEIEETNPMFFNTIRELANLSNEGFLNLLRDVVEETKSSLNSKIEKLRA
jgi:hypothetical protein